MKLTDHLIIVSDTYRQATGLSRSRVSTIVFAQGMVLDRVAQGSQGITVERFQRAMEWFSDNWPDNAEWPAEVPRYLYGGAPVDAPFEATAEAV